MKTISINSKKHGARIAFLDDEDFKLISEFKWRLHKSTNTFYALGKITRSGNSVRMHRLVLNNLITDKDIIDHHNHNGLDCQKKNLRICNQSDNAKNTTSRKGSTSIYLGVYLEFTNNEKGYRFVASIKTGGKKISLGSFKNEKEAAFAYNAAALKYHGEFANINILER